MSIIFRSSSPTLNMTPIVIIFSSWCPLFSWPVAGLSWWELSLCSLLTRSSTRLSAAGSARTSLLETTQTMRRSRSFFTLQRILSPPQTCNHCDKLHMYILLHVLIFQILILLKCNPDTETVISFVILNVLILSFLFNTAKIYLMLQNSLPSW